MSSSEKRERCIIKTEAALMNSRQKSRSETPSMLFIVMPSKPSSAASKRRSISYVVPASAQEPMGD